MLGVKTFGQYVVLLIAVVAAYRAYKRWRTYKAIRKVAGKVVLVTGASSGLGEGTILFVCAEVWLIIVFLFIVV